MDKSEKDDDRESNLPLESVVAESDEECLISGEYEIKELVSTTTYVSKGNFMPLYCGKKVKWILSKPG